MKTTAFTCGFSNDGAVGCSENSGIKTCSCKTDLCNTAESDVWKRSNSEENSAHSKSVESMWVFLMGAITLVKLSLNVKQISSIKQLIWYCGLKKVGHGNCLAWH